MKRNLQIQASLYTCGFICTYIFAYVYRMTYIKKGSAHFALVLCTRIFRPLQGLFNIIIYTRVRVSNLCSATGMSWFRAFFTIVTTFDDNEDGLEGNNRSGHRRKRGSLFPVIGFMKNQSSRNQSNDNEGYADYDSHDQNVLQVLHRVRGSGQGKRGSLFPVIGFLRPTTQQHKSSDNDERAVSDLKNDDGKNEVQNECSMKKSDYDEV